MGRIGDLCSEIASVVDEGPDGFVLPVEAWERLGADWPEEDIEDGINFVTQSIFQSELVEAADSLSTRLLEVLGAYGEEKAFASATSGGATIDIGVIRQLAHRLEGLEEALEVFRDEVVPDRRGFDELQRRLIDEGIEHQMHPDWEDQDDPTPPNGEDPDD